jgi:hypothetical protein
LKALRKRLKTAVSVYFVAWGCFGLTVYPIRLIQEIDFNRKDRLARPAILGRSISFAPALLWVNWQEGDGAFNCAGFQGIFFATPFGTKLLWKRMAWIS